MPGGIVISMGHHYHLKVALSQVCGHPNVTVYVTNRVNPITKQTRLYIELHRNVEIRIDYININNIKGESSDETHIFRRKTLRFDLADSIQISET